MKITLNYWQKKNKNCPVFLGCDIAEKVLSHVFKDVRRMHIHNSGFDFICNKGFKIDVKSSCLHKNNTYSFAIRYNKIADYFLCIGFDNRENLNPQHIWLIKGNEVIRYGYKKVNDFRSIGISNTPHYLEYYSKYELNDKLKETIEYCEKLNLE